MNLSTDDIRELLLVLNVALVDTTEARRRSEEEASTTHLKEHREIIRKWKVSGASPIALHMSNCMACSGKQ